MIRLKKRLLFALLGLVLVWPALHMLLVATLELDPWKFCGFAMYATTAFEQRLLILELPGEREVNIHDASLSDETRRVHRKCLRRCALLGKLAPPHELAQAILAERPELQGVKIVVMRNAVSAKTSRTLALPGTTFVYRR